MFGVKQWELFRDVRPCRYFWRELFARWLRKCAASNGRRHIPSRAGSLRHMVRLRCRRREWSIGACRSSISRPQAISPWRPRRAGSSLLSTVKFTTIPKLEAAFKLRLSTLPGGDIRTQKPCWRGFDAWGIEETLRQSVGMFAFAVWDRERRTLILARDRMGEKPLYYGYTGSVLAFGSELKALLQVPGFSPAIDRGALALLLRHACVPAPHSIYEGLAKLPPATWLEFSLDAVQRRSWPKPMAYWSVPRTSRSGWCRIPP